VKGEISLITLMLGDLSILSLLKTSTPPPPPPPPPPP